MIWLTAEVSREAVWSIWRLTSHGFEVLSLEVSLTRTLHVWKLKIWEISEARLVCTVGWMFVEQDGMWNANLLWLLCFPCRFSWNDFPLLLKWNSVNETVYFPNRSVSPSDCSIKFIYLIALGLKLSYFPYSEQKPNRLDMENPSNRMFIDPDKTQKGKFTFSMSFRVGWLARNMLWNCCVRRIDVAAERPEGKWFSLARICVCLWRRRRGRSFQPKWITFRFSTWWERNDSDNSVDETFEGNIMEKFGRAGEISGTKIIINLYFWRLRRVFLAASVLHAIIPHTFKLLKNV